VAEWGNADESNCPETHLPAISITGSRVLDARESCNTSAQGHYSTGLLQLLSQIGTSQKERASVKDRVAYERSMKRFANVLTLLLNIERTVKRDVVDEICFDRNRRASVLHFCRGNK